MIDYFSHVWALRACLSALKSAPPPVDEADPQEIAEALSHAHQERGSAILGSLVDHLLQYSETKTSVEIEILRRAAALFSTGVGLFNTLNSIRVDLEKGLATPDAPEVQGPYNIALAALHDVKKTTVDKLRDDLGKFQNDTHDWTAPNGQQQGSPLTKWAWRDVFLARGTTAFVAFARSIAHTPRQRAFVIGALGGAAGNLLGSAYLNSVVGGPRRSHQHRHRLAAYSVGAWLRDNEPTLAATFPDLRTIADIRDALTFGASPSLPTDIKTLITQALEKTYSSDKVALPDLDAGYANLLEHLRLLDSFVIPPPPPALNSSTTAKIQGFNFWTGPGADNVHPGGSKIGTNYPGIGRHEDAADICATIASWFVWPPAGIKALINAVDGSSGPGPQVGENAQNRQALEELSKSKDAIAGIKTLYDLANECVMALAMGRFALAERGLLYPEPGDQFNPKFTQFQTVPSTIPSYPLLPTAAPSEGLEWPTTGLETPATQSSPFAPSASPSIFLTGDKINSVSAISPSLWVGMIVNPGSDRFWSKNYNLDSDRGFLSECWELAPGSAITSQPVNTIILDFAKI